MAHLVIFDVNNFCHQCHLLGLGRFDFQCWEDVEIAVSDPCIRIILCILKCDAWYVCIATLHIMGATCKLQDKPLSTY